MMVVFMVIVFMMAMVTVNLGKVALWKTATANAADTAALSVATNLGSQARAMCAQIRNTPNPGLCKSCVFGGWFGAVLGGLLILIALVILIVSYGSLWYVAGVLFILGVSYIVQTAVYDTHNIAKLNSRFNRLPPKTGLKLQAHMTALTMIADDPNTITDTRDIDGDGDRTEKIAAFADWFESKFSAIEAQVIENNRDVATEVSAKLDQARIDMQDLITVLQNEAIPVFEWIEMEYDGRPHTVVGPDGVTLVQVFRPKIDLTFWRPGDQGAEMCLANGDPCGAACSDHLREDSNNDEPVGGDPGDDDNDEDPSVLEVPPGIQPCDQVDFVIAEAKDFLTFADAIKALPDEERILSAGKWVEAFRDLGASSFQEWVRNLENWNRELEDTVKPQIVWPTPVEFSILPPPSPPVPVGENPVDWVIERIGGKLANLKDWVKQLEKIKFDPVDVPVEAKDMIYSWQDSRGCHHIGADVNRYKHSGRTTDLRIPKFHIIRKFAKTCMYVKRMTGEIQVVVRRFDQNQQVSPFFNMSHQTEPLPEGLDPCACTGEGHLCSADMQDRLLSAGIRSAGVARYSYKSSHGIRIKIAE